MEFQRQEAISLFPVAVDHDSSDEGKLAVWSAELEVADVLDVLLDDVVHFVGENNHFIFLTLDTLNMVDEQVLDHSHLMVKICA